ncbi:hypothetical protein J2Z32_003425 [Paenibacillus turicensis]|uniref:Uncharacterized protein n=1 Tax=Paenibacillus turicensis TaxID=160487 RepID=A0ABS4FVZ8_9BACL|nr:hypothetical protein [Paenibacillus turicensis]MBP1906761.1 hypothetical protein [Paenibacillus turicensis]
MFKRTLSVLLTLILLVIPLNVHADEGSSQVVLDGNIINNLDKQGEKLNEIKDSNSVKLVVQNYDFVGNSISIDGYVSQELVNEKKPFKLAGELKKADYTDTLIVGNVVDQLDNYDVIFFGIDKAPNQNISLNPDKFSDNDTVLKIYLMEKGTRNFIVSETLTLEKFVNLFEIINNSNNLQIGAYSDVFWFGKVLEPVKVDEVEQQPLQLQASVTSGVSDKKYTINYQAGIASINEEIVVRSYIEGPLVLGSSGDFTAKLYILSQRTYSTTNPSVNSNTSNFEVGVMTPTSLQVYTDVGDAIRSVQWDGTWKESGSLNFDIGWSLSLLNTGLSFSPSYTNSSIYYSKTYKNFDNSGKSKVRSARIIFPKNASLVNTGHTFDAEIKVGHYETTKTKRLNLKWTYYIWNNQSIYSPAVNEHTSNMYFQYKS